MLVKILRVLIPVVVVGFGIGIFLVLLKTRPTPQKEPRVDQGTLVEVKPVAAKHERLRVLAKGSVLPEKQVVIQPEVSGKVTWQDPNLVPGGRFKKGQALLRIDASDYALSAAQAEAAREQAEQQLKIEQSRTALAAGEWEIIGDEATATDAGKAVALREPQLKAAEAALQSAQSKVAQARLSLGRTALVAPFNGFVKEEAVDVGQVVSPATRLLTFLGSDRFWVQVSVPVEKLAYIDVPGLNTRVEGEGSPVTVHYDVGGKVVERQGRVLRLLGDLDPVGRMARLLVAIDDPLGLQAGTGAQRSGAQDGGAQDAGAKDAGAAFELPILIGAFVDVAIEAHSIEDVVEIPRLALRGDSTVYVYGKDDRLEVRDVEVVWRRSDSVLIRNGLEPGEEVIVSRVPNAVPGLSLRKLPEPSPSAEKR